VFFMNTKLEEISSKLTQLLHKKEEEEKRNCSIVCILAIIGAVAAVAAIAYGVYKYFTPDYLEDFDDAFDDDFDDDFYDDDEVITFSTKSEDNATESKESSASEEEEN